MTERKWTPGPWRVEARHGCDQLIASDGASLMGNETYYPWTPENMADWHLIAAAPDLYEALESAVFWLEVDGRFDVQGMKYALAKARGEA